MTLLKKAANGVRNGFLLVGGAIFCLFSSVVIHASGLDKVDSWPTPEEIEKQNAWAAELKKKYPSKDNT